MDTNSSFAERWLDRVISAFGITHNPLEAGYILPDGRMLDFSGKRRGARPGNRTIDHREVDDFLDEDYDWENQPFYDARNGIHRTDYMLAFVKETNSLRVSINDGFIHLDIFCWNSLTEKQLNVVRNLIKRWHVDQMIVDINNHKGNVVKYFDFEPLTRRVMFSDFKEVLDWLTENKIT